MARLLVKTPQLTVGEILLNPGCNRLGREAENDFPVPHPSISRHHCEVWLTEDAVLVRDLSSQNGTFVNEERVNEAEVFAGQTLRLGDVELVLAEAPVRISVPDLPLPSQPKETSYLADGTPCCLYHDGVAGGLHCTKCLKVFCLPCVRQLRVAGGVPRRFCPECGGPCELLAPVVKDDRRAGWLNKLVDVFTKPSGRRP
jgi:hypothetical protein